MKFTAKNARTYEDITLTPPNEIRCVGCGMPVKLDCWQPMEPPNAVYRCQCGETTVVHCVNVINHWPEQIQAEFHLRMEEWFNAGMPIEEEAGMIIHNGHGVVRIELEDK